MDWSLIVVFLWSTGQPPIFQIPVETKGLCEIAADQMENRFDATALGETLGTLGARVMWPEGGGVYTECIQVGQKANRLRYDPGSGRLE